MSESESKALYQLLSLLNNPFIKDYVKNGKLTGTFEKYQAIFDEMLTVENLDALKKLSKIPVERLLPIFKAHGLKIFETEMNALVQKLKEGISFKDLFSSNKTLFALLLLQSTGSSRATRDLSDALKKFIKEEFAPQGITRADEYEEFKHFLLKEIPLLSQSYIDDLETKNNDYLLIQVYARVFGKGMTEISEIEKQLTPVDTIVSPTILERLDTSEYEPRSFEQTDISRPKYKSHLDSLRAHKIMVTDKLSNLVFEEHFQIYENSTIGIDSSLVRQIQIDLDRRTMIIRIDGREFTNAKAIYGYLTEIKRKTPKEALKLMSVLQQSGTNYTNKIVKQIFLGRSSLPCLYSQTDTIRIDHNPTLEFGAYEIELDLRNTNSPIVTIQTQHKIVQNPNTTALYIRKPNEDGPKNEEVVIRNVDTTAKELCRMKVITKIEGTDVSHFIEIH